MASPPVLRERPHSVTDWRAFPLVQLSFGGTLGSVGAPLAPTSRRSAAPLTLRTVLVLVAVAAPHGLTVGLAKRGRGKC